MTTVNEYNKQANDFLTKTNTSFKAEFLKYDLHFEGDKDKRNIFKITLSNNKHSYSFNFGSSINDSCVTIKKPITEIKEEIEVFVGLTLQNRPISGSVKFKLTKSKDFKLSEKDLLDLADDMANDYNNNVNAYNKKNKRDNKRSYFGDEIRINPMKQEEAITHINKKIREVLSKEVDSFEQSDKINSPTAYDVLACLQKYEIDTFEDFCGDYGYDTDSRKAESIYKAVKDEHKNVSMLWNEDEIEELQEIN
jgi:hypothetical protein